MVSGFMLNEEPDSLAETLQISKQRQRVGNELVSGTWNDDGGLQAPDSAQIIEVQRFTEI